MIKTGKQSVGGTDGSSSRRHKELSHSETLRDHQDPRNTARSWSAVALYRFLGCAELLKNARGLAHSKTRQNIVGTFCLAGTLGDQLELKYRISLGSQREKQEQEQRSKAREHKRTIYGKATIGGR